MIFPKEPGELNMDWVDHLHQTLMAESGLYRTAAELKLVGLMNHLQLAYLERTRPVSHLPEVKMDQMTTWSMLAEEVKNIPSELAIALSTARPELLSLMKPRQLTDEEFEGLINVIRVLMITNQCLQEHSAKVAQKLENVRGSLKGLTTQVEKTYDFSLFLNEIEGEDDAS